MIEAKVNPRLKVEIEQAVYKVKLRTDKEIRRIAEDIFDLAVFLTPVDTGALKASWNMSRGFPQPIKRSSLGRFAQKLKLLPAITFTPIHITNGQPYAVIVEYGLYTQAKAPYRRKFRGRWMTGIWSDSQGFSIQAPGGMLRLAVRQAIRKHNARR